MATPLVEIGDLPEKTDVEAGNWLVVDDGGTTKKIDIDRVGGTETIAEAHIADTVGAHAASAVSAIGGSGMLVGNTVQDQLDEADLALASTASSILAHTTDDTNAHAATAIAATPPAGFSGSDVQAILDDVGAVAQSGVTTGSAAQGSIDAHVGDLLAAHAASAIAVTPTGTVAAVDVQGAIVELDGDIQAHINDTSAAHTASSISFTPTGTIGATNVQAALAEIVAEGGSGGSGGGGGTITEVNGQTGPIVLLTQDNVDDGTTFKQYSASEQTKLATVNVGATANASDAALRDRVSHTGTQAQSTVTDLVTDLTAIRTTRPVVIWYNNAGSTWPNPGVDDTIMVIWAADTPGTPAPAYTGTRPGRLPHDLVLIPQAP